MTTFVWRLWGTSYNSLKYLTPLAHTRTRYKIEHTIRFMHSKLSERWKLSFRFELISSRFDLIWFALIWWCASPEKVEVEVAHCGGNWIKSSKRDSKLGACLTQWVIIVLAEWQVEQLAACLARLSPGLTGLAFLLIRYMLGISEVCQPHGAASTLHNSVLLLLSTCIYEVETRSRSTNYPGRVAWELSLD